MSSYKQKSFIKIVGDQFFCSICTNGPAIWGGCVTRRKHRAESWYFSRETVTVQGGYGVLFAVMVQIWLSAGAIAVQVWSEPHIYPRLQIWLRALARSRYKPLHICLEGRSKAKSVTNNLPILSVLVQVVLLIVLYAGFV